MTSRSYIIANLSLHGWRSSGDFMHKGNYALQFNQRLAQAPPHNQSGTRASFHFLDDLAHRRLLGL